MSVIWTLKDAPWQPLSAVEIISSAPGTVTTVSDEFGARVTGVPG